MIRGTENDDGGEWLVLVSPFRVYGNDNWNRILDS